MSGVGLDVRLGCGIVAEGREFAKVEQLGQQLVDRFGPPIAPGTIWVGDKIDDILAEIAAEMHTPPSGIEQIRAEWNRRRQGIHRPQLVVVAAYYPPMTDLDAGEIAVQYMGRGPRADA